jgi:hypothetical protein
VIAGENVEIVLDVENTGDALVWIISVSLQDMSKSLKVEGLLTSTVENS